jgi:adenosylhomocysteine nucleosidase
MRIGIVAALPLELKGVVRGWERVAATGRHVRCWRHVDAAGDVVMAACAGMGAEAARRAFAAVEAEGALDLVLSVGLAGATDGELRVGALCVLSEVIDTRTGERFPLTEGKRRLRIATMESVADATEKRRLFSSYGAVMVDMEAATVARMAAQRGIPMCCIKAVSDEAGDELPNVMPYVREGQLRMMPFVASVLVRPKSWGGLLRLGRNSGQAAQALAAVLNQFLLQKDWERVNRTGSVAE